MRFRYTRDTWQIEYQDEEAKTRAKVTGLMPAKADWMGASLSKEKYAEQMMVYKRKAMRMWGALDKSSCARFDVDKVA